MHVGWAIVFHNSRLFWIPLIVLKLTQLNSLTFTLHINQVIRDLLLRRQIFPPLKLKNTFPSLKEKSCIAHKRNLFFGFSTFSKYFRYILKHYQKQGSVKLCCYNGWFWILWNRFSGPFQYSNGVYMCVLNSCYSGTYKGCNFFYSLHNSAQT